MAVTVKLGLFKLGCVGLISLIVGLIKCALDSSAGRECGKSFYIRNMSNKIHDIFYHFDKKNASGINNYFVCFLTNVRIY